MEKPTIFDKFGGTRKMATALGEAPSTVNSWKASGRIPAHRQPAVLEKARELDLDVSAEDIVFPLGGGEAASIASQQSDEGGKIGDRSTP